MAAPGQSQTEDHQRPPDPCRECEPTAGRPDSAWLSASGTFQILPRALTGLGEPRRP
jgi:hypothetical protein